MFNLSQGLFIFCIIILFNSCALIFNVKYISYDEQCKLYRYKGEPLRFVNKSLVTANNIDTFFFNIQKNRISPILYKENDFFIRKKDVLIYNQYKKVVDETNNYSSNLAIIKANEFLNLYPDGIYYSDIDFIIALNWYRINNYDSAKYYLNRFQRYAAQKYPAQIRGYASDCRIKKEFCELRNVKNIDKLSLIENKKILPPYFRYYYQSFSDGYALNPDDKMFKFFNFTGFQFEKSNNEKKVYGLAFNVVPSHAYYIFVHYQYAQNYQQIHIALPFQLKKADDFRWGMKGITGSYVIYNVPQNNISYIPIVGMSLGYHFSYRFYAGFQYLYNFYSYSTEYNSLVRHNWRITLNAHLMKGISAIVAVKNKDCILGTLVGNTFIGFNFNRNMFELKIWL